MTKKQLEVYRVNKRLIDRNKKRIEDEKCKDGAVVMGKVKGSSPDFPYISQRFNVQMEDPDEAEKSRKRIEVWEQEICHLEKQNREIEHWVECIEDALSREILTYRYLDGMKTMDVAAKVGYTHGRISQIVSKILKD